jgi:hypothetical protein
MAVGNGRVWYGHSDSSLIGGFSVGSGVLPPLELLGSRVHVTREHLRKYEKFDAAFWGQVDRVPQQTVSRHHSRVEYPDSFPAYQGLIADELGFLWVREYQPRWSEVDYRWDVYDPSGRWSASVSIPFALLSRCMRRSPYGGCRDGILEIGEDYILVDHRDQMGVQRVKRFRLQRD